MLHILPTTLHVIAPTKQNLIEHSSWSIFMVFLHHRQLPKHQTVMRGAATAPQPAAMRLLSSAAMLLLLILLSYWLQPAASQGLDVSQEALGAGAQATATEFEKFEDALTLATLGGRGRGGRGQSASLGSFGSVKDLQRLQVQNIIYLFIYIIIIILLIYLTFEQHAEAPAGSSSRHSADEQHPADAACPAIEPD